MATSIIENVKKNTQTALDAAKRVKEGYAQTFKSGGLFNPEGTFASKPVVAEPAIGPANPNKFGPANPNKFGPVQPVAAAAPRPILLAGNAAPAAAAPSFNPGGFQSADPGVQTKIAAMQAQAGAKPPVVGAPAPAQAPLPAFQFAPQPERPVLSAAPAFDAPAPPSLSEIRKQQTDQAQSLIDATETIFKQEVARLEQQGKEAMAQTSSISVGAGLAGSPFQQASESRTQAQTDQVLRAKAQERQAQIAQIMAAANQQATQQFETEFRRFQQEREFAVSERDKSIQEEQSRKQAAKNSLASIATNFAKGGHSLSAIPAEQYQKMLSDSGMTDFEVQSIFTANNPTLGAKTDIQNGSIVTYYMDPATGKPVISTTALPPELQGSAAADIQTVTTAEGVFAFNSKDPRATFTKIGAPKPTASEQFKIVKIDGVDYQQAPDGSLSLPAIPSVVPTEEKIVKAQGVIDNIDALLADPNTMKAVGPISSNLPAWMSGARNTGRANIESLIASIAIENLALLKGPMSDKDIQFIKDASAGLRTDMSEAGFKTQLLKIRSKFDEIKNKAAGGQVQSLTPAQKSDVDYLIQGGMTEREAREALGFNQPLSMGEKGSADVSGIRDFSKVSTLLGSGVATGIRKGSSAWKYGYDLVLDGGKGAPVKSPFGGEVVFAGRDGGFGNSVKVKMDNGEVVRLSHLDQISVKPGQRLNAGVLVGTQGNTGKTIGKTGIHVDITMYKPDGKPYSSQEVASFLNTQLV